MDQSFKKPEFSNWMFKNELHFAFEALSSFEDKHSRLPATGNEDDANEFVSIVNQLNDKAKSDQSYHLDSIDSDFLKKFAKTCVGDLNPMVCSSLFPFYVCFLILEIRLRSFSLACYN